MKKNTYNTDGLSAEDRALNTFAELMIEKIRNLQEDWKKPDIRCRSWSLLIWSILRKIFL